MGKECGFRQSNWTLSQFAYAYLRTENWYFQMRFSILLPMRSKTLSYNIRDIGFFFSSVHMILWALHTLTGNLTALTAHPNPIYDSSAYVLCWCSQFGQFQIFFFPFSAMIGARWSSSTACSVFVRRYFAVARSHLRWQFSIWLFFFSFRSRYVCKVRAFLWNQSITQVHGKSYVLEHNKFRQRIFMLFGRI